MLKVKLCSFTVVCVFLHMGWGPCLPFSLLLPLSFTCRKLHQQFESYKDQVKKMGEETKPTQDQKSEAPTCGICHKTKFADGCGHLCSYCQTKFCARCGGRVSLRSNKVTCTPPPPLTNTVKPTLIDGNLIQVLKILEEQESVMTNRLFWFLTIKFKMKITLIPSCFKEALSNILTRSWKWFFL